jgi:hypothetical protein
MTETEPAFEHTPPLKEGGSVRSNMSVVNRPRYRPCSNVRIQPKQLQSKGIFVRTLPPLITGARAYKRAR